MAPGLIRFSGVSGTKAMMSIQNWVMPMCAVRSDSDGDLPETDEANWFRAFALISSTWRQNFRNRLVEQGFRFLHPFVAQVIVVGIEEFPAGGIADGAVLFEEKLIGS